MVVVFKLGDAPKVKVRDGWMRTHLVEKDIGRAKEAKDFGALVNEVKPEGIPPMRKPHWHRKRETLYFILSGRCVVSVEGKEYELGPNSLVFIAPGEKHAIIRVIEDMKMFEVFSHPEPDMVTDEEEEKESAR